jgi:hypothetical protein
LRAGRSAASQPQFRIEVVMMNDVLSMTYFNLAVILAAAIVIGAGIFTFWRSSHPSPDRR